MEPLIARAFFTLLLTPAQIAELKAYELTLPVNRYLQGFEIGYRFSVSGGPLEESREQKMLGLLRKWEGINWKKNQIEEIEIHEKLCARKRTDKWCRCRTRQQEVHEWMDYVIAHWSEPPLTLKRRSADKFEEGIAKESKPKRRRKDFANDSAEFEQSEMGQLSEV